MFKLLFDLHRADVETGRKKKTTFVDKAAQGARTICLARRLCANVNFSIFLRNFGGILCMKSEEKLS